jgi:hypothetical protein
MTDKQLIIMLNMIADMVQNQLLPDVLDTIYTGEMFVYHTDEQGNKHSYLQAKNIILSFADKLREYDAASS